MTMRSCLFLLLLCCIPGYGLQAQTEIPAVKKSCSCGFSSINQIGVATGKGNSQFQFQTINGFRYRSWFTGIGLGIDNYNQLSVPLFLDVRKYLWMGKAAPFLYADMGYNVPVNNEDTKPGDYATYSYRAGLYYDAGLGYALPISRKTRLLFSAGYSGKHYKVIKDVSAWVRMYCNGNCDDYYSDIYRYRLNRWSVKAGIQF